MQKRFAVLFLFCFVFCASANAQEPKALPQADERYKADILVVVAHPDDEGAVTPYLARALDEHKRVALVYGTRGSSGANEAGAEQAAALGAVREIEARNALMTLGITNAWFLDGKDTASQNVLQSLANWDHGECLEQLVRLVRLTRPEVILTFSDHQPNTAVRNRSLTAGIMCAIESARPIGLRQQPAVLARFKQDKSFPTIASNLLSSLSRPLPFYSIPFRRMPRWRGTPGAPDLIRASTLKTYEEHKDFKTALLEDTELCTRR